MLAAKADGIIERSKMRFVAAETLKRPSTLVINQSKILLGRGTVTQFHDAAHNLNSRFHSDPNRNHACDIDDIAGSGRDARIGHDASSTQTCAGPRPCSPIVR
jgi:hypothetical protein